MSVDKERLKDLSSLLPFRSDSLEALHLRPDFLGTMSDWGSGQLPGNCALRLSHLAATLGSTPSVGKLTRKNENIEHYRLRFEGNITPRTAWMINLIVLAAWNDDSPAVRVALTPLPVRMDPEPTPIDKEELFTVGYTIRNLIRVIENAKHMRGVSQVMTAMAAYIDVTSTLMGGRLKGLTLDYALQCLAMWEHRGIIPRDDDRWDLSTPAGRCQLMAYGLGRQATTPKA